MPNPLRKEIDTVTQNNALQQGKRKPGFLPGQPRPAKAGRKRGTPNKITVNIREMIERALHKAGGIQYLTRQAHKNPAAFMGLVGRILPQNMTISGSIDQNITVSVEVRKTMALDLLDQLFAGRQAAMIEHRPADDLALIETVVEPMMSESEESISSAESQFSISSNEDS